jgi:hypothetical protein
MLGSVVAVAVVAVVVVGKAAARVAGTVRLIALLLCAPAITGQMHAPRKRSDVARSSPFIVSKLRQFGFDERAGGVPDHLVAHA